MCSLPRSADDCARRGRGGGDVPPAGRPASPHQAPSAAPGLKDTDFGFTGTDFNHAYQVRVQGRDVEDVVERLCVLKTGKRRVWERTANTTPSCS